MAFSLWGWIKNQWDATKGNLWWSLLKLLFTVFGGGTLTASIVKYLQSLAKVPQTNFLGYFIVGAIGSLTIAICIVGARWRVGLAPKTNIQSGRDTSGGRTTTPKEVDIHSEILQLHFQSNPPYGYTIFLKLKLTNRGLADATIGDWMLFMAVGAEENQCDSLGVLPTNLAVKRTVLSGTGFISEDQFEQMTPNLGEMADRNPLKRGIPQVGWICFRVGGYDIEPAVNAGMTIYMTDSLGGFHSFVREPQNYKRDGEVVEREIPLLPLIRTIGGSLGGG